ncbi:hypothetical protein V968_01338 [Mycobacterium tuberculosis TB_RSA58]|nr:hypothetical protein V968_01338 [Mycobacterium tuberculosis TB_RSA58]
MLAQFPGGDQRAQPGQQPVVVALGLAAGVAVDGGRIGGGVDDRGVWSSGLVAPGAASLASTASKVARAWGVR